MDAYKKNLRTRMNLVSVAAAVAALLYVGLMIYREHLPVLPSFIKGFHIGAFVGLELILGWYLGQCMRASKKESELKRMYIAENDERTGLIIRNASTLGMSVVLFGLAIAAIVSGFFSATVFYTLMASLLFVLIVFYGMWVYYARKL